ncbi:MAG: alpha/beta hydrolase, partial [Gammaproteobacteria bacterium]|nr:alpha/beta hydrolase [Gammaproteobacteria bacterium]
METWLRLAAVALAAYVGVCLLLYLLQDWMIFFPRSL